MNNRFWFTGMTKTMENKMIPFDLPFGKDCDKSRGATIRWIDENDHYELIFTDDFITPSSNSLRTGNAKNGIMSFRGNSLLTDVILDMRKGNKQKEVHVFVGSFGGEVAALSMILQQLLCYRYRVGINLGTACSCGWMLLFACPERYVSPFSQTMYQKVLTDKELELGKTSEVWLTGRQLIERNAAKDFSEYLSRQVPAEEMCNINGELLKYSPFEGGWIEYSRKENSTVLSYADVLKKINTEPPDNQEDDK